MWETLFTGGMPQTGVITLLLTCAITLGILIWRVIHGN
jgi:hypothetical protein